MPTFRPAQPTELPTLLALLEQLHPAEYTLERLERHAQQRRSGSPFARWLAGEGNEVVGYAQFEELRTEAHEGWLEIQVGALPKVRDTLAPQLLALAETGAAAAGATTLVANVKEDWWEHEFLLTRGYTEHDRRWLSTLDFRTLDWAAFAADEARAKATGVRIVPLSELEATPSEATQRRLYHLIIRLLADIPSATTIEPWPFELWQQRSMPYLDPQGVFLAVAPDGEWVGITELYLKNADPQTLGTGLTGVLAAWRGHGLGLALKLASARATLARGYTHTVTSNHGINRPMLAINERLGFVRGRAILSLHKELL